MRCRASRIMRLQQYQNRCRDARVGRKVPDYSRSSGSRKGLLRQPAFLARGWGWRHWGLFDFEISGIESEVMAYLLNRHIPVIHASGAEHALLRIRLRLYLLGVLETVVRRES